MSQRQERESIESEIEAHLNNDDIEGAIPEIVDYFRRPDVREMRQHYIRMQLEELGFLPKSSSYVDEAERITKERNV